MTTAERPRSSILSCLPPQLGWGRPTHQHTPSSPELVRRCKTTRRQAFDNQGFLAALNQVEKGSKLEAFLLNLRAHFDFSDAAPLAESYDIIAYELGLHRNTVYNYVKQLKAAGLVRFPKRSVHRTRDGAWSTPSVWIWTARTALPNLTTKRFKYYTWGSIVGEEVVSEALSRTQAAQCLRWMATKGRGRVGAIGKVLYDAFLKRKQEAEGGSLQREDSDLPRDQGTAQAICSWVHKLEDEQDQELHDCVLDVRRADDGRKDRDGGDVPTQHSVDKVQHTLRNAQNNGELEAVCGHADLRGHGMADCNVRSPERTGGEPDDPRSAGGSFLWLGQWRHYKFKSPFNLNHGPAKGKPAAEILTDLGALKWLIMQDPRSDALADDRHVAIQLGRRAQPDLTKKWVAERDAKLKAELRRKTRPMNIKTREYPRYE